MKKKLDLSVLKFGEILIPECVKSNYVSFFYASIVVLVASIFFIPLFGIGVLPLGFVISAILFLYAYFFLRKISIEGYDILECQCIEVNYTVLSKVKYKKVPSSYIVKELGSNNIYKFYPIKNNTFVRENDFIKVYLPKSTSNYFVLNNVKQLGKVYGYEYFSEN